MARERCHWQFAGQNPSAGQFAHARSHRQERIVLAAPARRTSMAVGLLVAANQPESIFAYPGPGRQVLGKIRQEGSFAALFVIFRHRPWCRAAIAFFHVMGDKVQDIKAFDALLARILLRVAVFSRQ